MVLGCIKKLAENEKPSADEPESKSSSMVFVSSPWALTSLDGELWPEGINKIKATLKVLLVRAILSQQQQQQRKEERACLHQPALFAHVFLFIWDCFVSGRVVVIIKHKFMFYYSSLNFSEQIELPLRGRRNRDSVCPGFPSTGLLPSIIHLNSYSAINPQRLEKVCLYPGIVSV